MLRQTFCTTVAIVLIVTAFTEAKATGLLARNQPVTLSSLSGVYLALHNQSTAVNTPVVGHGTFDPSREDLLWKVVNTRFPDQYLIQNIASSLCLSVDGIGFPQPKVLTQQLCDEDRDERRFAFPGGAGEPTVLRTLAVVDGCVDVATGSQAEIHPCGQTEIFFGLGKTLEDLQATDIQPFEQFIISGSDSDGLTVVAFNHLVNNVTTQKADSNALHLNAQTLINPTQDGAEVGWVSNDVFQVGYTTRVIGQETRPNGDVSLEFETRYAGRQTTNPSAMSALLKTSNGILVGRDTSSTVFDIPSSSIVGPYLYIAGAGNLWGGFNGQTTGFEVSTTAGQPPALIQPFRTVMSNGTTAGGLVRVIQDVALAVAPPGSSTLPPDSFVVALLEGTTAPDCESDDPGSGGCLEGQKVRILYFDDILAPGRVIAEDTAPWPLSTNHSIAIALSDVCHAMLAVQSGAGVKAGVYPLDTCSPSTGPQTLVGFSTGSMMNIHPGFLGGIDAAYLPSIEVVRPTADWLVSYLSASGPILTPPIDFFEVSPSDSSARLYPSSDNVSMTVDLDWNLGSAWDASGVVQIRHRVDMTYLCEDGNGNRRQSVSTHLEPWDLFSPGEIRTPIPGASSVTVQLEKSCGIEDTFVADSGVARLTSEVLVSEGGTIVSWRTNTLEVLY